VLGDPGLTPCDNSGRTGDQPFYDTNGPPATGPPASFASLTLYNQVRMLTIALWERQKQAKIEKKAKATWPVGRNG
jgi:hypothetical protein